MTKRNQLTATFCKSVTEAGRYQDGGGLMLIVKPSGGKSEECALWRISTS